MMIYKHLFVILLLSIFVAYFMNYLGTHILTKEKVWFDRHTLRENNFLCIGDKCYNKNLNLTFYCNYQNDSCYVEVDKK